jgi:hypothetical protein
MPPKKSAKQLDRDIADALATAQVRDQWPQIADLLARSPGRSVIVVWTDHRYHEASYAKTDMPALLTSLRKHDVHQVRVDDHEFTI